MKLEKDSNFRKKEFRDVNCKSFDRKVLSQIKKLKKFNFFTLNFLKFGSNLIVIKPDEFYCHGLREKVDNKKLLMTEI